MCMYIPYLLTPGYSNIPVPNSPQSITNYIYIYTYIAIYIFLTIFGYIILYSSRRLHVHIPQLLYQPQSLYAHVVCISRVSPPTSTLYLPLSPLESGPHIPPPSDRLLGVSSGTLEARYWDPKWPLDNCPNWFPVPRWVVGTLPIVPSIPCV